MRLLNNLSEKLWILGILTYMVSLSGCNCLDTDDHSLVTGECELNKIDAFFDPNPVTIYAGDTAEIYVEVMVNSNCEDFVQTIYVTDPDDPIQHPITGHMCKYNGVMNNSGGCTFSLIIDQSEPSGVIIKKYEIWACSEPHFTGKTIKGTDTLEIHVETPTTTDYDLYPLANYSVLEGRTFQGGILIERLNSHDQDIYLNIINMPDDVSYSFNPNPVPGNETSTQIYFSAEYFAIPGTYFPTIEASDGTIEKSYPFTFTVMDQYQLLISEDTLTMATDTTISISIDIDITYSEVYTDMDFSADGTIIGPGTNMIQAEFDPNPAPWGDFTTVLSLTSGTNVIPDSYLVTISGATDNLEKVVNVVLIIQ